MKRRIQKYRILRQKIMKRPRGTIQGIETGLALHRRKKIFFFEARGKLIRMVVVWT